jgi:hypothetical protein
VHGFTRASVYAISELDGNDLFDGTTDENTPSSAGEGFSPLASVSPSLNENSVPAQAIATDSFTIDNGETFYFNSAGNKLGGNLLTIAGELLVIAVAAVQVGDNQFNVPLGPVDVWGIGGFNPAAGTQSLDLRLSYFDTSTNQLSDEALFVNQTNDGWTNATLRIVQLDDTGQETVLAVGEVALAPPAVPGLARPLAFVALFLMLAVGGSRASFVHRPPAVS